MPFQLSRREFLTGTTGLIAAGATASAAAWQSAPAAASLPDSPFHIAVINDEISQDFARSCEVASKQFGMRWIELRGMWKKNILALDDREVAESIAILKRYGLRVTDIGSPLFKVDWPDAPLSKVGERDQFNAAFGYKQQDEVLQRSIELAKKFGTNRVRCFDFWRLDDQKPYRKAINEALQQAAEKAGKQGITLVLENEGACNTATGAEAAQVLAEVKSRYLMLNWDPGNAASRGEVPYPDGYKLLPKERIGHCHCKDVTKDGDKYTWAAMGQGIIDWTGQFEALKGMVTARR